MDYFWDTSGVRYKNSISAEMPLSCSETAPKLPRLIAWFDSFDKFLEVSSQRQRNKQSEAAISERAQGSSLDPGSGGSWESGPSPGCAQTNNADGAPSEKSHVFFVLIKHHLQESDSLSFSVKM